MTLRHAFLGLLFLLPGLGLLIGVAEGDNEPYRPSGQRPTDGLAEARLLPRSATPETGFAVHLANVPLPGPPRLFTVDATTESVWLQGGETRVWESTAGTFRVIQERDASPENILHDIVCDDDATMADIVERTADVQVEWGNLVTCRFVNKDPSTTFLSDFETGDVTEWTDPVDYCSASCGGTAPAGCSCDPASCLIADDCCPDVCTSCGPC